MKDKHKKIDFGDILHQLTTHSNIILVYITLN